METIGGDFKLRNGLVVTWEIIMSGLRGAVAIMFAAGVTPSDDDMAEALKFIREMLPEGASFERVGLDAEGEQKARRFLTYNAMDN